MAVGHANLSRAQNPVATTGAITLGFFPADTGDIVHRQSSEPVPILDTGDLLHRQSSGSPDRIKHVCHTSDGQQTGLRRLTFLRPFEIKCVASHSDTYQSSEEVPSPLERLKAASRFLVTISGRRKLRESPLVNNHDMQSILPLEEKQWLEALDKHHRVGGDLKEFWEVWHRSETTKSFFDWLDHSDEALGDLPLCTRDKLDSGSVKYCTAEERQAYLVEVTDGVLRNKQSGELLSGSLIFVMGLEGHLYMGIKKKRHFHHSSFLAGTPVLAAGQAHLQHGRFMKLMPYSGHYRPQLKHFGEFVVRMREKGLAEDQCTFLAAEIGNPDFFDKSIRGK